MMRTCRMAGTHTMRECTSENHVLMFLSMAAGTGCEMLASGVHSASCVLHTQSGACKKKKAAAAAAKEEEEEE